MKKVMILLTVMIMILTLSACIQRKSDITNYNHDVQEYYADLFMPDLDSLGEYQKIEYSTKHDNGLFPWDTMQLIVKYDEEIFSQEKELLNTSYSYLKQPKRYDDGDWYMPVTEFIFAGYDFRVVEFEDTDYPRNFGMVGISEEKCEIAYLWVYDPDLDLICMANDNKLKAMHEFMEYHFSLENVD